jgi:hypothetical protein
MAPKVFIDKRFVGTAPQDFAMKTSIAIMSLLMSCAWASQVQAMSQDDYKLEKTRIAADYKAARGKCAPLNANAKDICLSDVRAGRALAKGSS